MWWFGILWSIICQDEAKTNSFVLYLIIFIKEKLTSLLKELDNWNVHNNDPFNSPGKKGGAIISRLSIIFM